MRNTLFCSIVLGVLAIPALPSRTVPSFTVHASTVQAGSHLGSMRVADSAIRTVVTPATTEVYVDGYFAGKADDFNGTVERLQLPAGPHDITFRLAGYVTASERIYLRRGETRDLVHQMRPLAPGACPIPAPAPEPIPD